MNEAANLAEDAGQALQERAARLPVRPGAEAWALARQGTQEGAEQVALQAVSRLPEGDEAAVLRLVARERALRLTQSKALRWRTRPRASERCASLCERLPVGLQLCKARGTQAPGQQACTAAYEAAQPEGDDGRANGHRVGDEGCDQPTHSGVVRARQGGQDAAPATPGARSRGARQVLLKAAALAAPTAEQLAQQPARGIDVDGRCDALVPELVELQAQPVYLDVGLVDTARADVRCDFLVAELVELGQQL